MASLAKDLYKDVVGNIFNVYDIFKDFFGESRVDLHLPSEDDVINRCKSEAECREFVDAYKPHILVFWPTVTVTNEYNKSIVIYDLYAKIYINVEGKIPWESPGFTLNRAKYPYEQFVSGYMHSHIGHIPTWSYSEFQNPCLGTGPIKDTIASLRNESDESFWMLFCQELAMYVTVESISGIPYNRLENVGNRGRNRYPYNSYESCYGGGYLGCLQMVFPNTWKSVLAVFTDYYLTKGHLRFDYTNGNFICGLPFYNFIIDISNCFIDFCNEYYGNNSSTIDSMFTRGLLEKIYVTDGKFVSDRSSGSSLPRGAEGSYICTFKGEEIRLHIINDRESSGEAVTILTPQVAVYILTKILKVINYRFKNERNRKSGEDTPNIEETVCYL